MAENERVMLLYNGVSYRILLEMYAKDDMAIRLGDTLDVKASIGLVVITFLATQTVYFFGRFAWGFQHLLLTASIPLLAMATICAFVELWPRTYLVPFPESSVIDRAKELSRFYAEQENADTQSVADQLTQDETGWAKIRISANQKINREKSQCLGASFYFMGAAMILNIAALFTLIRLPF